MSPRDQILFDYGFLRGIEAHVPEDRRDVLRAIAERIRGRIPIRPSMNLSELSKHFEDGPDEVDCCGKNTKT